ncbi:amino acid ABC transporter substrate-binding protein [Clostridium tetanomorphum DSM 665]|uniref:ABC transporter substrate-binding protein n=1 Tax=Clostridium tetanomorphum TaxID=1553 RepID=UPI00044E0E57|nr:ABC transporter substrate-binding protein [Clostridium tetanomorphum]KAJ50746.1 amino acid ABC transporter substrate-binding protein [Clostridium tetanomorphum DSM 665]NRZ98469.1 branched-chain amino acid transport system substrate-binding protein [Clostridium tetanomorphum]
MGLITGSDEDGVIIISRLKKIFRVKERGKIMKKKLSLFMALLMTASLFAGCGKGGANNKDAGSKGDTIKIGLDYELSNEVALYGQSLVTGIELAFKEINEAGGVLGKKVEIIKADNKSDTAEAANVAAKLATRDKVVAILGPATSGSVKAAIPQATQNKVPLISASSTADDVTVDSHGKVRDYIFKTCFSDSFQGVILANFAVEDLKSKNAAILMDTTSDYSKGLSKSFKETYSKLGGKVVTEQAYQAKDKDFKAVLTNIKNAKPDLIYLPGYYEEVGLIVKQARELGLNVPILGGDGYDSPKLAELAGKQALNKVYYTNHYSSKDTSNEVVKFKDTFKKQFNKEPDAFNALGYDLAYFVADALKRAGESNREKLKEALASTKGFKGITGELSIDENHNPVKSITILEVKNGEPTFLKKQQP